MFDRCGRIARAVRSAALALVVAGCGRSDDPIRIGLAGALSDPVGEPMLRAATLAVDEINAAGGIRGRRVELVARDDFADPDSAVGIATDLYQAGVVAVVGHLFSGTTLAAAPVYNGGTDPVVAISPSSSSPEVSYAGDWTFRVCPSDLMHGRALAQWVHRNLRLTRGAVLYLNDQYGRGVRQTFVQEFSRAGGELISVDPYLDEGADVGPFLDRIARDGRVQFIMVAGNRAEAEEILRQVRRRGLTMPLIGADGLEGIEQAGPLAEGVLYTQAYLPILDTPANRKFVAAYRAKYPDAPPPNQPAAATYDAILLLRDVIARAGTSRPAIREALAAVGTKAPAFEGVSGAIAFDRAGDVPDRPVYVGVVRDGAVRLAGES